MAMLTYLTDAGETYTVACTDDGAGAIAEALDVERPPYVSRTAWAEARRAGHRLTDAVNGVGPVIGDEEPRGVLVLTIP